MTNALKISEAPFKDYYLLLQVHPEADFAMIDAAYWHLARRYNQAALADRSARAKLDELNEAYAVLGSSSRRDGYDRRRNQVLGLGALPAPPPPPPERVPLPMMQRHRPLGKDETEVTGSTPSRFSLRQARLPPWQGVLSAGILLVVATAALGAWTHPAAIGGLLVLGIAFSTLPLLGRAPRLPRPPLPAISRPRGPRLPRLALPAIPRPGLPLRDHAPRAPRPSPLDAEALHQSTDAARRRLRQGGAQPPPAEAPFKPQGHEKNVN